MKGDHFCQICQETITYQSKAPNEPLRVHSHPAEAVTATVAPQKDLSSVAGQRNTARHFGTWHASWLWMRVRGFETKSPWRKFPDSWGWCFRHPAFTSWRFGSVSHYFQGFIDPRWLFGISEPPQSSVASATWSCKSKLLGPTDARSQANLCITVMFFLLLKVS